VFVRAPNVPEYSRVVFKACSFLECADVFSFADSLGSWGGLRVYNPLGLRRGISHCQSESIASQICWEYRSEEL